VVGFISSGWQYPQITCARITVNGKEFKTDNFKVTEWKQSSNIEVKGKKLGALEVYYLKEKPEIDEGPFLKEERHLIESLVLMLGEVAESKKTEEELREYREHLEELVEERTMELTAVNKELEAFAYSVSHDLRSPLRSIDGFSQALLEDYPDKLDEQGKGYLQRVRSATQRMGILIDDLLSLSRVTRSEMRRDIVDLSALAQSIAEELQETQPERQVDFVIAPGLTTSGDSQLLHQLMENLLGNAWKFTGQHPKARIEFGVTQVNGKDTFLIRDDGVGFDMTYAEKLFGVFQRLHSQEEFSGTGVGLATVQRIAHRHGGQVWAEGKMEEGATFYFTL
jgi:light-regulated signal transduction histidine kinase (bacteriophytochrome)